MLYLLQNNSPEWNFVVVVVVVVVMLVQVTLTLTQNSTGLKVGVSCSDMTKKECSVVEALCLGMV